MSRPPISHGSLKQISEDEYSFKLKTPWSDGTTHLILSPMELIEKLAALLARTFKRYLDGVGLPSEIPELKPARPLPQLEFEYADPEYAE